MDNWITRFSSSQTVDPLQKVIIPGEPEAEAETERKANGIPLVDAVVKDLNEIAQKFGVDSL
jgi:LDH2 family malate/lactate/ureidoglycolate dehydrogenase